MIADAADRPEVVRQIESRFPWALIITDRQRGLDFERFEPGQVEVGAELDQAAQLGAQPFFQKRTLVPQTIIAQDVAALFDLGQPTDHDRRDRLQAGFLGGRQAAVSGEDHPVIVNDDRVDVAHVLHLLRQLIKLLLRMMARIARIGLQAIERPLDDFQVVVASLGHDKYPLLNQIFGLSAEMTQ